MKIVFVSYSRSSSFTNPQLWLNRTCFYGGILEQLAKQHEVHSIEQINFSGQLEQKNVSYHFLWYKKNPLLLPLHVNSYIKSLKPDVIVVHGFIFPFQMMLLKMMLPGKTKLFVQHHAEKPGGKKMIFQKMADRFVTGYFFTATEMGDEWITKKIIYKKEKIVELMGASSYFLSIESQKRKILGATKRPVFLWVGRLDRNKDPLTAVEAFLLFRKSCPSAKLYMIYQENELLDELTCAIEKQNGQEAIVLVGKVEHRELENWYNSAGFIISTSHYEGSGIAVCEAMSCGCIPILTNIASFRKMTGYGKCGLLFPPGDSLDLKEALVNSMQMDMEKEKAKVILQFEKELSFKAIAEKMSQVFLHSK